MFSPSLTKLLLISFKTFFVSLAFARDSKIKGSVILDKVANGSKDAC